MQSEQLMERHGVRCGSWSGRGRTREKEIAQEADHKTLMEKLEKIVQGRISNLTLVLNG